MRSDKVFSYLNAPFARAFLRLPPCASVFAPAPCAGGRRPLAGVFLCMKFRIQIKTAGCRPCAQSFPRAGRAGYGLCSRRSRFRASAAPAMVSAPAADVSARRPRRLWSPLPPRTFPCAGRADFCFPPPSVHRCTRKSAESELSKNREFYVFLTKNVAQNERAFFFC